ncbi:MAG TPA: HEAT repeat domain-containing protein [Dehalococcoidia bacterium]|nr:HEAT repeat domain-containing protein [Dehalococcoidia bacterium]
MSLPIEETIAELGNSDKPLLNSKLAELSNLNSEELALFEKAWQGIEPKRRRQIIYRLVELAEDNFELDFDSIFKSRLKDPDDKVRSKAIEGLWESEEASLIDPLIELLEQDKSEEVQAAAATALGKFAMLAELKKLRPSHKSRICQALLAAIDDQSKPIEVKRRALEAAAPLSLPQMEKAIVTAYKSAQPKLRISALFAMGKSCNHSWLPILLKELTSADAEMRYEAAGACGELGEKEAAPYLVELITDPDVDVQLAAIRALGKIGGPEAKDCLEQCLNESGEVARHAAEQALKELEAGEDPLSFRI